MKTKLLLTLALILGISYYHWAQTSVAPRAEYNQPIVEVVVTQDKVWLLPDEKPVENLPVQILNEAGAIVLKRTFSSDSTEWSLDVSELPAGKYKIQIGALQTEYLEKQGRVRLL